jgi:hypothetical protein
MAGSPPVAKGTGAGSGEDGGLKTVSGS